MTQNLKLQLPSDLYAEIESYIKAERLSFEEFILWSVSEKVGEIRERRQVKNLKYIKPLLLDAPIQRDEHIQKSIPEEKPPAVKAPKRLLTAKEAAKILSISSTKMYHMMQVREIPVVSFGRSVRLREEDLDEFIIRQREEN